MINPNTEEQARRDAVMSEVISFIKQDIRITLPDFRSEVISTVVGAEENAFCGTVGSYRYQFEGEEDLLHLIVTRQDKDRLTVEEAQQVAGFLLPGVPAGLIWLRPGEFSQHFWVGHDELCRSV